MTILYKLNLAASSYTFVDSLKRRKISNCGEEEVHSIHHRFHLFLMIIWTCALYLF